MTPLMAKLQEIEDAAKEAKFGPYEHKGHGVIVGGEPREFTRGFSKLQIAMICGQDFMETGDKEKIADFFAACSPATILSLTQALRLAHVQIESLFEKTKHGDEAHKKWLKEAIDEHFSITQLGLGEGGK